LIRGFYIRCLKILEKRDLRKLVLVVVIQVGLSLLDLVGVALIGILGALTVSGIQSQQPTGLIFRTLDVVGLASLDFQRQAAYLGIAAALTMILRTFLSIISTRRVLYFLSSRGAQLSSDLLKKFLSQPITAINGKSTQQTLYALTQGVMNITLGVIGNSVTLIADLSLLLVLFFGILAINPLMAVSTVLVFALLALSLYRLLHRKAQALGESQAKVTVRSNERIVEIIQGFREIAVRNRKSFYAREISSLRFSLSKDLAESSFLPYIGKYVLETSVILGALVISAIQFALSDAANAIATMSVFLAAAVRIAPAILRMQHSGLQIQSALGAAGPTLDLVDELTQLEVIEISDCKIRSFDYPGFSGNIYLEDISFVYPGANSPALTIVNAEIQENEFIGIVGLSGAGKSTLADLILGLLEPSSGTVLISGRKPIEAIEKWSGAISYVPQEPMIINGSIRENVALGFPQEEISERDVVRALKSAQLEEFVESLPQGLDTNVGERGAKLSGGQRQRIGIARALYTNPKLIIFDEATSALDGKTEAELSLAISNFKKRVTIIVIAHRLSTVQDANRIFYMKEGRIEATGSFKEVRQKVSEFNEQARLMGL
jgi:ABC-type multidrug transport system fused ATPase/permease subunit